MDIKNAKDREQVLKSLNDLKSDAGWKLVCQMLEDLQSNCEEELFIVRDGDSDLKYSKLDILRRERKYIEGLLSYPDFLIKTLVEKSDLKGGEFDPY